MMFHKRTKTKTRQTNFIKNDHFKYSMKDDMLDAEEAQGRKFIKPG